MKCPSSETFVILYSDAEAGASRQTVSSFLNNLERAVFGRRTSFVEQDLQIIR